MSHINQSCWGRNTVWVPAGGTERDSLVHTCESINKLRAPLFRLFVYPSFCFFLSVCVSVCLCVCLSALPTPRLPLCNTHLTGGSTSVHSNPSLIDTLWEEARLALSALHWLYQGMFIWMLPCTEIHEIHCSTCSSPAFTIHMPSLLHRKATIPKRILHRKQYCSKSERQQQPLQRRPEDNPVKTLVTAEQAASQRCSAACRTAIASINEEGQVWDYLSPPPLLALLLASPPSILATE